MNSKSEGHFDEVHLWQYYTYHELDNISPESESIERHCTNKGIGIFFETLRA
jgi:hypothetical protein